MAYNTPLSTAPICHASRLVDRYFGFILYHATRHGLGLIERFPAKLYIDEPLLAFAQALDKLEMSRNFYIVEDLEEDTFWLSGYSIEAGLEGREELVDIPLEQQ